MPLLHMSQNFATLSHSQKDTIIMSDSDKAAFKQAALDYHTQTPYGKIKVVPTKAIVTQRDLSLAYSPGVAHACEAIVADPSQASVLTLVAIWSP